MSMTGQDRTKLSDAAEHLMHQWGAYEMSFTWMGTTKALSKDQKGEMAQTFDAAPDWLSGSKRIIDTQDLAWKRLTVAKKIIKEFWEANSLPWPKDGVRLVKREGWGEVQDKLRDLRNELKFAASALNDELPRLIDRAQTRLGSTFSRSDYPAGVCDLFDCDWEPVNVDPPEYLAAEHPGLYEEHSRRIAQRFDEAARMAEEAFLLEFSKAAQKLQEKLTGINDGQPKRLRASNVENLREFFDKFRRLNLHSSEELDNAVAQAEAALNLGGHALTRDDLRDSSDIRQHVATKLSAALATVDGLLVNQPRRNINRRK
ncbi:MAG: hypothetical protein ABSG53_10530 [Thermoguttaceae bacterium]